MSLEGIIAKIREKTKGMYKQINEKSYIKEAAIGFLTVSGPLALYLGYKDAFIYKSLNTITNVYGIAAISALLTYHTNRFWKSYKKHNEFMDWVKDRKQITVHQEYPDEKQEKE